jgi:hypothetical protein
MADMPQLQEHFAAARPGMADMPQMQERGADLEREKG